MNKEQFVLRDVAGAVNQEPVELKVDILPRNWVHARLQKWKVMPSQRALVIRPVTMGTLMRISSVMLSIDASFNEKEEAGQYSLISQHGMTVARIIALAVHNNRSEPSGHLVRFIIRNFSVRELMATMIIVLKQMNVTGFTNTITLMRGMNALERSVKPEVSPADRGS